MTKAAWTPEEWAWSRAAFDDWRRTKEEETMAEQTCAMCGGKPDAGMRERVANGDLDVCEPCYRIEYKLDPEDVPSDLREED